MSTITVAQVESRVPRETRSNLGADSTVIQAAIDDAEVWVTAKFKKIGETPDFTDAIVKTATIDEAIYRLYKRVEAEEQAIDKHTSAINLLWSTIGNAALDVRNEGKAGDGGSKGAEEARLDRAQAPIIKISAGTDNWNGYGGIVS